MRFQMNALEKEEVPQYIKHHMKLAGNHMYILGDSALEAISLRSQGWPLMINTLATHSLFSAISKRNK